MIYLIYGIFFKEDYKTIYKGLFTLCSYLKTKGSYDRWITRRVWRFRHQISKAKYPKISQNVGRKYQEASGEHRGIVQNGCETFQVSAVKGSGHVCPGKLKRPPLPSGIRCRMWNIWRRWNVCRTEFRMWDIRRRWNVARGTVCVCKV